MSHSLSKSASPATSPSFRKYDLDSKKKHLVLIGGGHAHVQAIKSLSSRPSNLSVTLIDAQAAATYSGMVPGAIADAYTHDQTLIQLKPLAEWARITFIHEKVVDIDLEKKQIYLETTTTSENPLRFDACSLDIGSTARDFYKIPGASENAIPTRPIASLITRTCEVQVQEDQAIRFVVVGGGIAGIELAMSVHGRWKNRTRDLQCTIVDAACKNTILPLETRECRDKLLEILNEKNINIQFGCGVEQVDETCVHLKSGEKIPFTHCIWAAGAGAHDLAWTLQQRGLAVDQYGWIKVNGHLQSTSHPFLFAAGDCASHPANPPKAGVYAVRSGPILLHNFYKYLYAGGEELADYVPQDDFLKLLACGDGSALGFRFGIPIHGKWVFKIKDTIDNAFMDLFRVEKLPAPLPRKDVENEEQRYGTAQYDVAYACSDHDNPLDPAEAAVLLQREDDDVDHNLAWKILRDMVCISSYRVNVLEEWFKNIHGTDGAN